MKYLLLIAVVFLLVWWWRRPPASARPPQPPAGGVAETPMVRCDQCGLHLPREEALRDGDAFFCCDAHRRLMHGPDA